MRRLAWIDEGGDKHACMVGEFVVRLFRSPSGWRAQIAGVSAVDRWNVLQDAKEGSLRIAHRWFSKAAHDAGTESA